MKWSKMKWYDKVVGVLMGIAIAVTTILLWWDENRSYVPEFQPFYCSRCVLTTKDIAFISIGSTDHKLDVRINGISAGTFRDDQLGDTRRYLKDVELKNGDQMEIWSSWVEVKGEFVVGKSTGNLISNALIVLTLSSVLYLGCINWYLHARGILTSSWDEIL